MKDRHNDIMIHSAMNRLLNLYFQKVLYTDLTEDLYYVLRVNEEERLEVMPTGDNSLSGWLNYFADSDLCHPMDRERFRESTRLEYLRDLFVKNEYKMVRMKYRRKEKFSDPDYQMVVMDIVPEIDEEGHLIAFFFVRNIVNENIHDMEMIQQLEGNIVKSAISITEKKSVLVVDDNAINRDLLVEMLEDEYLVYTAGDGFEGLDVMKEHLKELSLVVLDVHMPNCDGFEFLKIRNTDIDLQQVPVVVVTESNRSEDEIRCLKLGATDFISKPFNEEIVKMRIDGTIRLHESMAMLSKLETDSLTGLLTKTAFYHRAKSKLERFADTSFDIAFLNIENFKWLNERYGEKKGDEVLRFVGRVLANDEDNILVSRFNADHFVVFFSAEKREDETPQIRSLVLEMSKDAPVSGLVFRVGIYEDVPHNQPVSVLCDRAAMAASTIKNEYGKYHAYYDDKLRQQLKKRDEITDCMETALMDEQFQVFYQPKHDVATGKIAGAEALVRWIHPEMGFMSPGDFIPVFEENGFISKVDYYVWDRTCKNQRKWQDEGLKLVPISVNASRRDFFSDNYLKMIMQSVAQNEVDPKNLHIEITESIYTENPDELISTVKNVQSLGFAIEMDDFGSGYSSLNMLSSLPMDILKLDMRFMGDLNNPSKRIILETCITLAKRLNLKTVAEGVETAEQRDVLEEMGCDYIQGYYYAKPMPEDEFKKYLAEHI